MGIRNLVRCTGLVLLAGAGASCGDVVRSSDAPVMLVFNSLTAGGSNTFTSDVVRSTGATFNDIGTATLTVSMKDVTVAPTTNNAVTINRYRVAYRRADGHNTPGVDVPHPFDGAVTLTILAGASGTVSFEIVRHVAKEESPLVQLAVNPNVISTITDVTFFGTDRVGNEVAATGSMQINFANFADAP